MRALAPVSVLFISLAFLAPRVARAQDAAEVTCKDGTKSHAGKGACSGHGGVDKSASSASAPATKSESSSKSTSKSTAASGSTAAAAPAEGAEVTCKDGTKSHAGKGACSGHGGVDKSGGSRSSKSASGTAAASSASSAPAAPAEGAEVTCKDGTTSHAGKGACSGHGGVDKSAGAKPKAAAAAPATAATSSAPASSGSASSAAEVRCAGGDCRSGDERAGGRRTRRDRSRDEVDRRCLGGKGTADGEVQGRDAQLLEAPHRDLLGSRRRGRVAGRDPAALTTPVPIDVRRARSE